MRAALYALALLAAPLSRALAQTSDYAIQPNAVVQLQQSHILDGEWRVGGLGTVTFTTRPDEVLEGSHRGRSCHGQYRGNAFSLLCPDAGRGALLLTGWAFEEEPVATTARARIAARPARMAGQVHQIYLDGRAHAQEIGQLSGTRQ